MTYQLTKCLNLVVPRQSLPLWVQQQYNLCDSVLLKVKLLICHVQFLCLSWNILKLSCSVDVQTRHQQGDSFPLTVDEILDETNQLDIGAKNRHWLSTEVRCACVPIKLKKISRSLLNVIVHEPYSWLKFEKGV